MCAALRCTVHFGYRRNRDEKPFLIIRTLNCYKKYRQRMSVHEYSMRFMKDRQGVLGENGRDRRKRDDNYGDPLKIVKCIPISSL